MWLKRHNTLIMAIGTGFAAIVLVFVAVLPIYKNASVLLGKIKKGSIELQSLTDKVSILSKLDPNVLQERLDVLDSAVPPRKDILLYLTSIEGLSRELGLTFGSISLSPGDLTEATASAQKTTKSAGLQSLETELKIQGNQDGIYTFLRTIENVLPLMQIKDIKVSILTDNQYSLSLILGMLWAEPATLDLKGPVTLFGEQEDKYFTQLSEYRRFDVAESVPVNEEIKLDLFAPYGKTSLEQPPKATPKPSVTIPQQ